MSLGEVLSAWHTEATSMIIFFRIDNCREYEAIKESLKENVILNVSDPSQVVSFEPLRGIACTAMAECA